MSGKRHFGIAKRPIKARASALAAIECTPWLAGFAPAQCNYGVCLEYGCGVEKDLKAACEWYAKSADQGNSHGQCNLGSPVSSPALLKRCWEGWMYESGQGVEKDQARALALCAHRNSVLIWLLCAIESGISQLRSKAWRARSTDWPHCTSTAQDSRKTRSRRSRGT